MLKNDSTATITGSKSTRPQMVDFLEHATDVINSALSTMEASSHHREANTWRLLAGIVSVKDRYSSNQNQRAHLMELLSDYFPAERVLLFTVGATGSVSVAAGYGYNDSVDPDKLHLPKSIAKRVKNDRKSVLVASDHTNSGYEVTNATPSVLALPVESGRALKAIIYLERDGSQAGFTRSDLLIGELAAEMVGLVHYGAGDAADSGKTELSVEKLFERFPLGLILTDADGAIVRLNPLSAEILDQNLSDILSRQKGGESVYIWELLPDSQVARWRYMITTALTSRQNYHETDLELDTGYLVKSVNVDVSPWENAANAGVLISLADVTEASILDEYLILGEKLAARGELADEVGRKLSDIRLQMAQVVENLNLLIERKEWDKLSFNMKKLGDDLQALQTFASSLSDLSRPATEFISYDMKVLIEDILFSLRDRRNYKQIHFTVDMDHDLPNLEIDVYQIQQLLRDLIDNAAEATERRAIEAHGADEEFRRRVGIHAHPEKSQEWVRISIEDNGPGLSASEIARIFDLHYTTKAGAHGIGLYNCRRTVEMHHGQITVGKSAGGGTTVDVILPRVQPRSERSDEEE